MAAEPGDSSITSARAASTLTLDEEHTTEASGRPGRYEGWTVVVAAAVVTLITAAPVFYGFGTIFTEIVDEFGWSVAVVALGFSIRNEVGGLAAPLTGAALDRWGPRLVVRTGVILLTIGLLALSFIHSLWQFYAAMFIVALAVSGLGGQPGHYAIATWFRRKRARAMSFMTLGGGAGGVVVVAMAWLVDTVGWRSALRLIAVLVLGLGLGVGRLVRRRPPDHPQPIDGVPDGEAGSGGSIAFADPELSFRRALREPSLHWLFATAVFTNFAFVGIVVHQVPYLERTFDAPKELAGLSVTVFTLMSIAGRLGFGYVGDHVQKRVALAGALGLMVAGMVLVTLATSTWQAFVAVALVGPGFGGTIPLRPAIVADYFGIRSFGKLMGVMRLVSTTGGAIGAWFIGLTVDMTDSYRLGWTLVTVAAIAAIPLVLAARPPTPHGPTPAASGG